MNAVRALVADAACDPPLGAAERVVATVAAEAVLRGLGAAALAHPRARLYAESDDAAARAALLEAAAHLEATVIVRDRAPHVATELRLPATRLAEDTWRAAGSGGGVVVAVAGAVERAVVILAPRDATVAALAARAVPSARAWVALWGGGAAQVVAREARIGELVEDPRAARRLLVLPARHALVRRARTPLAAWIRRARSACAGCGICAPACPASLPVPEMLRALAGGAGGTLAAAAVDCTACGACDLACPQAISPARIVDALGRQLREGGVAAPPRRRRVTWSLPREAAMLRMGLQRLDRAAPTVIETL